MVAIAILVPIVGAMLVYAAFKGGIGEVTDPRDVFIGFFSGIAATPKRLGEDIGINLGTTGKKGPGPTKKAKAVKAGTIQAGARAKSAAMWVAVHAKFPRLTFLGIVRDPSRGLNNCANPSTTGSCRYSQHNYGNALDIGVGTDKIAMGDDCVRWLKANRSKFSIRNILFRGVPGHYPGHIHVDFNPQYCGDPPGKKC